MKEIEDNFEQEIDTDQLVVVDFAAQWCGPCNVLRGVLTDLEQQFESVKFCKVDIDKNPEIASNYKITAVPTVVLIRNKQEVKRVMGLVSKTTLQKAIEEN